MNEIFSRIHRDQFIIGTLDRIKSILFDLYGTEKGEYNYTYLVHAAERYLESLSEEDLEHLRAFDPSRPYDHLKGKIFAISYPDNIYIKEEPTLRTLSRVLKNYFPGINGIHILPERLMSHEDVWPQDFFMFMGSDNAVSLVDFLEEEGFLDTHHFLTKKYETDRSSLFTRVLPEFLEKRKVNSVEDLSSEIMGVLDGVYNSHFNDGGFSQKTRSKIDPRFGTHKDLKAITSEFSVMLDYVVNHLDIDNEYLDAFRQGKNNGDAFIIIDPAEYEEMKEDGSLARTFRPRPFPLYTGVRKYPPKPYSSLNEKVAAVNKIFIQAGLEPLDGRLILFLSIYFKVRNDQGLTAEDVRILSEFTEYLKERGIAEETILTASLVRPSGKTCTPSLAKGLPSLIEALGIKKEYGSLFTRYDDEIFGEKFFVYTTFSESQADINPVTVSGFKVIIDDLFHLLSSGRLAMMRMDAIKYLWKEKGKRNFDMEEGNKLIEVIRRLMQLVAPGVLPLDEVNSPDPVVYEMEKDGGFAYLFGQVNTTVIAFNEETLKPLERFYTLFKKNHPEGFVPFIMLSTHDGRSVQGLGVQRTDGHVSVEQFYRLKKTIEEQEGKAKYRSVPVGEIAKDTFNKVVEEAGLSHCKEKILALFTPDSVKNSEDYILPHSLKERGNLLEKMAVLCGGTADKLSRIPAVDYFLDWIVEGRTVYELCATSRSSFLENDDVVDSQILEAKRFALAQAFVLSFGQAVPAIYFNDLLGLVNDVEGFKLSGKPRDLNRHKSFLPELHFEEITDSFNKEYFPFINRLLSIRGKDKAFYPGSKEFEFIALNDQVFLNHPFYKGNHSFIGGNISGEKQKVLLDITRLEGELHGEITLTDQLTGRKVTTDEKGVLSLDMKPYEMFWFIKEIS